MCVIHIFPFADPGRGGDIKGRFLFYRAVELRPDADPLAGFSEGLVTGHGSWEIWAFPLQRDKVAAADLIKHPAFKTWGTDDVQRMDTIKRQGKSMFNFYLRHTNTISKEHV